MVFGHEPQRVTEIRREQPAIDAVLRSEDGIFLEREW
jgi:hypothetical protein